MRILLDECIPRALKAHFVSHECRTVPEAGYDVFLTLDKGMQYQQNLSGCAIAVLIVKTISNRIEDLINRVPACLTALDRIRPGQVFRV